MKKDSSIFTFFITIAFLSLLSYGCDSKTKEYKSEEGTVKVTQKDEKADLTMTTKEGDTYNLSINQGNLPEGWPPDIEVIPGGQILISQSSTKDNMLHISIQTDKPLSEAADYYKKQIASGGWVVENTMNMPDMNMITANRGDKKLVIQIAAGDGQPTMVQISLRS